MRWKTIITSWLPDKRELLSNKVLQMFENSLHDPNLWGFNRRSVSKATAIGLFCAFLPMPFEMVAAAFGAIWLKGNLPLSVALVWISNPVTWIPLYTPAYLLGNWLLGRPVSVSDPITLTVLIDSLAALWLGCLIIGTVVSVLGYLAVNGLWRLKVRSERRERTRNRGTLKHRLKNR